uniref:Vanin-like protein 2 n=2 Tax=Lygus hesperus TaxID=30085 RepID=A0A146LL36_LYGHE
MIMTLQRTEWADFILISVTLMTTSVMATGNGYYRAAVVELQPLPGKNVAQNVIDMNITYGSYIRTANEQQVDIIVFPEAGLYGSDYSIFHDIPDPTLKIIPASNSSYDELVRGLSSYAKQYSMYIVVNLLEKCTSSGATRKFNTNVVFDRTGAVVARYRKFNLFGEPVDRTPQFEPSYFDSDFGVRFGQFVGLDILYKEPLQMMKDYKITDFIYSSEWFSALPFLTSVQTQWMFSVGNDVNLLAAGLNRVDRGSSGSGIFRGKNTPIGSLFLFGDEMTNGMVIGNVSIGGPKNDYSGNGEYTTRIITKPRTFTLLREKELDRMANENIELPSAGNTTRNFVKQICHGSLCCTFDIKLSYDNPANKTSVQYKAVVFDGDRTSSAHNTKFVQGLQVCGLVMCSNGSISSCGPPAVNGTLPNTKTPQPKVIFDSIVISGNFTNKNSSALPDVLLWPNPPAFPSPPDENSRGEFLIDPRMVNFSSNGMDGVVSLSLQPNKKIISCGIFSRVYSRDARSTTSGAQHSFAPFLATLLPFFTVAFYSRVNAS